MQRAVVSDWQGIQTRRSNKNVHPGTDLTPEEKRKTPPPKLTIPQQEEKAASLARLEEQRAKAKAQLAAIENEMNRAQSAKQAKLIRPGMVGEPFVPETNSGTAICIQK